MGLERVRKNVAKLETLLGPLLSAARVPGGAIGVVVAGELLFAQGWGYRDLDAKRPLDSRTVYPIASTTKAMNATLLGMLVDEGRLSWDIPVQHYLPRLRLGDSLTSAKITLRDLVTMRTGLPRHDWLWIEQPMTRADLIERLQYLELSAGLRERFQYNNLTVTASGHIAEVITERPWEDLTLERLFKPLKMTNTGFAAPASGNVTLSYHEDRRRVLQKTRRLAAEVTAPSGGAIHSTVEDMARWMLFNLNHGEAEGRALIEAPTLAEIHSPQVIAGCDSSSPSRNAAYAMGWFVDTYAHRPRLTHGGYLHDVNSEVSLFPEDGIGIVSFTNFGFPTLARLINQYAFDLLTDGVPEQTLDEKLRSYEQKIQETAKKNAAIPHVLGTTPSHPLGDYLGRYAHAGYGHIEIRRHAEELTFVRHTLELPLEHWHYDAWIARECDLFFLHTSHTFDPACHFIFETDPAGRIAAVSIPLEPSVSPIRFLKQ